MPYDAPVEPRVEAHSSPVAFSHGTTYIHTHTLTHTEATENNQMLTPTMPATRRLPPTMTATKMLAPTMPAT